MRFNHEIILGQPRQRPEGIPCIPQCAEHTFGLTEERAEEITEALQSHAEQCYDHQTNTADLHRLIAGPEHLVLTTPAEVFFVGYFMSELVNAAEAHVTRSSMPPLAGMGLPADVVKAMQTLAASVPGNLRGMTVMEIGPDGPRIVGNATAQPTSVPEGAEVVSTGNIFTGKTAKE